MINLDMKYQFNKAQLQDIILICRFHINNSQQTFILQYRLEQSLKTNSPQITMIEIIQAIITQIKMHDKMKKPLTIFRILLQKFNRLKQKISNHVMINSLTKSSNRI